MSNATPTLACSFAPVARGALPPLGHDEVQLWWLPDAIAIEAQQVLLATAAGLDHFELARGPHGKPFLAGFPDLDFNRSHSGDATLLAIARGTSVGVDLEAPRVVRRIDGLLAKSYTARERDAVLASDDPNARFLAMWAAKEAVVKAIGRGIAYGLKRVEIDAATLALARLDGGDAREWQVRSLALVDGYVGALAWRGDTRVVRCFAWLP